MSEELDPITGLPGDPEKPVKIVLSDDEVDGAAKAARQYTDPDRQAYQIGGTNIIEDIEKKYSDIDSDPGKITLEKVPKLYEGLEYASLKYKAKLAEEQGFWGELGGAVAQTAAEIVGGTLEGVGYLGDLTHWGDLISGGDGDWENWLSDAGSSLKEYVAEAAPIHENPLNPSTREWFLSGVPTVASFVGMMIPATGTVSALSKIGALGKAARISNKTSDLATLLKAGKSIEIAKTISVGGNRVKGLSTAIVSRHIENMMEANGVWKEQSSKYMNLGMSEEEANKQASEAAMQVYNQNWVMLAQDLPQYMMLGRGMNAARGVKSIRQASKMGDDVAKTALKKTLGVVGIGASEGAEEAYQYVVSQDAMYMNDYANGLVAEKGFSERLGEYIKEEDFFDAVFFGALGGVAMNTMGKPIVKAGDGIANMARHITGRESKDGLWGGFKKDWKDDPRVQEQVHRAAKISFLSKQLAEAAEKDDKLAYDNLRNHGVADMVMEAAAVGNYDRMVNELKELQNMTPEQLEESQVTEEFLNELPSILKEAEEIKDMWNAETKSTLPKYVGTMVSAKYKLKKLKDQQGGLQDELMKANENFNFGELLTETGQEYLHNGYIMKSLERSIEQAQFILDNKPHMSEWEKAQLQEQIGIKDEKTGEWTSGSWSEELENAKQFRVDSKASTKKEFKNSIELSNKDKELIEKILTTPSLDVVKAQTRLNWNTANINSHLNSLVKLGQTEYQTQIEDFQKAQVKTNEKIGKLRQLYNDVNSGQEATSEPQLGEDGRHYQHVKPLNHFNNQSKIKEAEEILETLDEAEKKRFAPVIEEMKSIVDDNRSVYQKRARQKNNKAKRIKGLKGYHRVNRLAKKLNAFRENNDPRFRELTPSELFISDQDVFRVTYKGKDGVLSQEEGEMTFTPNDGGTPHIISGRTSKETLEQLGIGMISEYAYPLEFSVEGDSLGIWIGDNLMSFSTLNPLSSIKWDKNENLASITLNDSKGNPVVITNPQLVAELSEFVYLYQELVDEFSKEEENVFLPEHGVTVQYNASNPNKSKLYKTDENGQSYEVLGELPLQENGKYTIKGVILNKFLDNFKIGVLTPMSKNKIIKDRDYANNTAKAKQQTQEQAASQEAGFNEPTGQSEVSEAKKRGEEVETEVADDIEETEEVGAVALSESGDNVEVEGENGKITVSSSDTMGGNFDNLSPEGQAELEAAGFGQNPNEEQGRNEEQNENEEESPFEEEVVETPTEDEQQATKDVEGLEERRRKELEPLIKEVEKIEKEIDELDGPDLIASKSDFERGKKEFLAAIKGNSQAEGLAKFALIEGESFGAAAMLVKIAGATVKLTETQKQYDANIEGLDLTVKKVERDPMSAYNIEANKNYTITEIETILEKLGIEEQSKEIFKLIKDVAKQLGVRIQFSKDVQKGTAGTYNLQQHLIKVRISELSYSTERAAQTTVHEIIHGITKYITHTIEEHRGKGFSEGYPLLTKDQIQAYDNLQTILEELKKDKNLKNEYGLSNIDELLAELANPSFVAKLKNKTFKNQSMLKQIVSSIAKLLGIKVNAYQLVKEQLETLITTPSLEALNVAGTSYNKEIKLQPSLNENQRKISKLKKQLADINKKIDNINIKYDKLIAFAKIPQFENVTDISLPKNVEDITVDFTVAEEDYRIYLNKDTKGKGYVQVAKKDSKGVYKGSKGRRATQEEFIKEHVSPEFIELLKSYKTLSNEQRQVIKQYVLGTPLRGTLDSEFYTPVKSIADISNEFKSSIPENVKGIVKYLAPLKEGELKEDIEKTKKVIKSVKNKTTIEKHKILLSDLESALETKDQYRTTKKAETESFISEKDWEEFVDEDYVSQEILEGIAKKMRDGTPFTEKELAVYQSKAGEIESINIIHSTKETENPQSGFFTVKLATGLIVKSPSHKLLINDGGEIEQRKSKLQDGSLEDQPYVFNFDMLNNPNVKEGHEVKFVHTPTQYSEEQDVEPGEEFINAPIYVFYKDGKNWAPVGLLQAGNTKERKLIFEALKTKDEVKATIKNQMVGQEPYSSKASNFRNRIDHDTKEPIHQSAHDSLSTAWVETKDGFELTNEAPIIILSTEGTSKATDTSSEPRFYDRDLDPKIASDISRSEIAKMKDGALEGHIWAAVINPSGVYVPFKLSTSNLTQEAKDKVEELILMGDYDAINEITHSNYDSDLSAEYNKFFQVINTGKSKFIRFKHKGIIYKIDHAQINKGLKGEKMSMFLQALDLKGKSLQSIKDKKGKVIKKEVTLEEFKGMISEMLNKKKFNVINSNLRTGENYVSPISGKEYNSYEDYLTGAKDINGNENAESPAEGPNDANSILQSDLWGHNGSFFFDQGVDYEIDEVSKKKPATKKTVKASTTTTTQTSEVELTPEDKIIWGHPGLGKTTFKENNPNNVLDFDTDFKPAIAERLYLPKEKQNSKGLNEAREKFKNDKQWTEAYEGAMRKAWKEAVAESKKTGKMLVVSDMMFLKENESDFDKVVTTNSATFKERATKRGDNIEVLDSWKNNIDNTVKNVDSNKVINTDKYFSEIQPTQQTSEFKVGDNITSDMIVRDENSTIGADEDFIGDDIAEAKSAKIISVNGVSEKGTSVDMRIVTKDGATTATVFLKPTQQTSEVEGKKEVKKEKSEPLFSEELTPPKARKVKAVKKHKGTAQEVTTAKINDIVKESDNFELATVELEDENGDIIDESVYLDAETNELIERQSNAVVRYINGDPVDSSKPDVIAGGAVGNLVDILGREIFAGNKVNFEAVQKEANKANEESGYNIKVGEDVVTKLKLILNNVYDELIASGHTIVSKDVFITAQYNNKEASISGLSGIGGTLDLIAIDKNGVAHIIDFKNIKLTEKNKNRTFENIFGGGRYAAKVESWSNQQTAYKIITEKYGVPVGSINILGVSTEYEYDETNSEIELKNVTLTTELVKNPDKYISPLSNGLIQLEESDIIKKELPPRIGNEVFTGKSATSDPTESFDLDVEDDSNDAEAEAFLKNKCK